MFFEVTSWQGEPINNEPHKCDELRWASLDALPENVVGEVRHALSMITAGETYSGYNFPKP
jgi:8-oxo-dGTP diphosphatase